MSSIKTKSDAPNSQRTKFLAAVLLGVALLVTLTWQSSAPTASETTEAAATLTTLNPAAVNHVIAANKVGPLPEIDLPLLVQQNPFRRKSLKPSAATSDGSGDTNQLAAANGQRGAEDNSLAREPRVPPKVAVTAIVTGNTGPAALIAGKLYHENDVLNDEWKIVQIRPYGLVLGPIEP